LAKERNHLQRRKAFQSFTGREMMAMPKKKINEILECWGKESYEVIGC
jgi:hypothetical protein